MKIKIFMFGCLLALNCGASEVDSFTHRYELKKDAAPILNAITNGIIDLALKETEQFMTAGCKEKLLRAKLKKYFNGNVVAGPIEAYVNDNAEGIVPALRFPRSQSIYREVKFVEAPVLVTFKSAVGAIMLIETPEGNTVLGADKLGHFFTEGLVYYKKAFKKKGDIKKVLDWGVRTEKGKFGLRTTGTYSYADLVANYKGMTFWANLTEKKMDAPGPYFSCKNGRWRKLQEFDWRNYVDAGFDEGINCSTYTKRVQTKVNKAIAELEQQSNHSFTCPIAPDQLTQLHTKYGELASSLLYPIVK